VLERGVSAGQKAAKVAVYPACGLGPILDEDGIVSH
jgi:hypothetical protein